MEVVIVSHNVPEADEVDDGTSVAAEYFGTRRELVGEARNRVYRERQRAVPLGVDDCLVSGLLVDDRPEGHLCAW